MTAIRINPNASLPKLIFNYTTGGTWSKNGTKALGTVEEGHLYAALSQGGATPMVGIAVPTTGGGFTIRMSGNYDNGSAHTTYACAFAVSGSTWTLSSAAYMGHNSTGNHGTYTGFNIGRVYRIA